ncbi:MAG: aminotransferase class III-fold pyridoxal phosphate-dependent enzyme, partial [Planctomycetes bacterium]|nr:aminotransferase class III-fold pyridoxal phosphate-dependent enzyme [Planctomycetota bacterium]
SGLAGTIHTFRYNRLDELDEALSRAGQDLAAIVMEPTRSVDPNPGFLEGVRERATRLNVPLIFDEISSGWRYCLGGAHKLYGVDPDIAVFAKALGNGFAMGAIIGTSRIMQAAQDSFISSTYWTEGVGPTAALAAVRKMKAVDVPAHLLHLGQRVMKGWSELANKHKLQITVSGRPGSCNFAFSHPRNTALMTLLTTRMLDHGFLAGSSCSMTLAHQNHHIDRYLDALDIVFKELSEAIAADDIPSRLQGPVKHSTFSRLVD